MRVAPWLTETPEPQAMEPPGPDPLTGPLTTAWRAEALLHDELVAARMAHTCVPGPAADIPEVD